MLGGMKSEVRTHTISPTRRVETYAMPQLVSCHSISGRIANSSVNWAPLTIVCRNWLWTGSIELSLTWSQLHEIRCRRPGRQRYPGRLNVSSCGNGGFVSGGPMYAKTTPWYSCVG